MNRVYLMNSLHQVRQNTGETIDSFHMRIQEKLVPLNLDKMTTTELTELITLSLLVNYCSNNNLRKKALKDGLDLENFLKNARAFERAEQQAKEITQSGDVNRIRRNRGRNPQKNTQKQGPRGTRSQSGHGRHQRSKSPHPNKKSTQCYKCGGEFPHKGSCPATSAKCDVCQKIGHYGRMCRHRDRNKDVQAVQTTEDTTSDDDHYMVPCFVMRQIT